MIVFRLMMLVALGAIGVESDKLSFGGIWKSYYDGLESAYGNGVEC